MTRDEIAEATYEAAGRLNELKRQFSVVDEATYESVRSRLAAAQLLLDAESIGADGVDRLRAELSTHRTMFGDDELKWSGPSRFRAGGTLLAHLTASLGHEIAHALARMVGRYDVAPLTSSSAS